MTDEAPAQPGHVSRTATGMAIVALLAVITAAIAAGWWFTIYPSTPQYAAAHFLDLAKARDYDGLYSSIELPDMVRRLVPNAQALQRIIETAPSTFPPISSYTLGDTTVNADIATVKATVTATGDSVPTVLEIRLHRTAGRWMVDGKWLTELMLRNGGSQLLKTLGPHLIGL